MVLPCVAVLIMILDHGGKTSSMKPMTVSLDAYSNARAFCSASESIFAEKYAVSARSFGASSIHIPSNQSVSDGTSNFGQIYRKFIEKIEFSIFSIFFLSFRSVPGEFLPPTLTKILNHCLNLFFCHR